MTFGVVPETPETGYGYIKSGTECVDEDSQTYRVEKFVEKPDLKTAESYLKDGGYYWNSGMFMFTG